jgi:hypothetical protein
MKQTRRRRHLRPPNSFNDQPADQAKDLLNSSGISRVDGDQGAWPWSRGWPRCDTVQHRRTNSSTTWLIRLLWRVFRLALAAENTCELRGTSLDPFLCDVLVRLGRLATACCEYRNRRGRSLLAMTVHIPQSN